MLWPIIVEIIRDSALILLISIVRIKKIKLHLSSALLNFMLCAVAFAPFMIQFKVVELRLLNR